jgi:polyisoprenyl-teichoic acid--peptidoglycan teichoic acid transferase
MSSRERPSRLDPETTASLRRSRKNSVPASRSRLVEIVLFSMFALIVILGGLALWASYAPSYRTVPNRVADGIEQDRVNVLVIGIGGKTHIGGGKDLADALMLASFRPSTGEVALLSIPRDLYVPIGRYGTHRINEAHRIGNQTTYPGRGPKLTMDTAETIFGVPIHAFVRVDFAGFEKIVDQIGGVNVYVERSFHDFLFDDGFEKGWQHLDGDRALRYARYRYVNDAEEGTTFGRERRQQQVVNAVREKLRRNEGGALELIRAGKTLSDHTATNLTTQQMIWFWRTFGEIDADAVHQFSLQPYVEVFELKTLAGAGEAVRIRDGDFNELRALAAEVFAPSREAREGSAAHAVVASHRPL